jgi:parallel beta-helix repeat protein
MRKVVATVVVAVGVLAFGSAQAMAKEITVGVASATCKKPDSPTINGGIALATPGDKIKVCPGTYVEQVKVPAGKDKVTLESQKHWAAIIQAPALMASPKAIVQITASQDVGIKDFTITGPGGGPCDSLEYGVRVDGGASATIEKNHITKIRDTGLSGCQNGNAVQIGRNSPAFPGDVTTGTATVKENLIDDYQKTGVIVANTGSYGKVEHNTVQGIGPTPTIAQNGIQISRGAVADVKDNDVSDNQYSPQTVVSTGVLLFNPGAVSVENNTVYDNDVNVYDQDSSDSVKIKSNELFGASFDGIDIVNSSGVTAENNQSHDNDADGIYLSDATSNTLKNNKLTSNGEDGIWLDGESDDNTVQNNQARSSTRYGLHAGPDASGNTLRENDARSSGTFDCRDESTGPGTAATANFWINDRGDTSDPPGICRP